MLENAIAVVVSLIVAAISVYFVDKKWGETDDSNQG
jgi:hypothetical protein